MNLDADNIAGPGFLLDVDSRFQSLESGERFVSLPRFFFWGGVALHKGGKIWLLEKLLT